ncbi:MAG: ABC transporter substrate-binding protein [Acidimicrobiaceae bacterium]|nr:ABC transporter substrate-binding protein [Acidimicrobiaceae bacterium]MDE0494762.1 ABC transporter substrate-binding protein [Acidimicrobiaceae bacterium]
MTIDNCGTEVVLESRPERIVTGGATPLNLLASLGAGDLIVGRTGEFGQPIEPAYAVEAGDAPILVPDRPSAEVVIGAGADLLYSEPPGLDALRPLLDDAGMQTLSTCSTTTFDQLFSSLTLLGTIVGAADEAAGVIDDLQARLAAVETSQLGAGRSTVIVSVFQNRLFVDGNRTLKHSMLDILGLRNVFENEDQSTFEVNVEDLIAASPDIIVLAYGTDNESFDDAKQILAAAPGASEMTAVQNDAIIGITFSQAYGSPPAIDGLEGLADGLASL